MILKTHRILYRTNNSSYHPNYLFIDTICITDSVGKNPEIVYDRTGHIDVGKKYKQQAKKWSGKRQLAERLFNPRFLQERGYFEPNGNTDLVYSDAEVERMNRLRQETDSYYSGTIFDFGRTYNYFVYKFRNK